MTLISYDFFTNAFLAAILASVVCGIIGTYIVSRRMVFISGGITHASFGGIGLAYFLGFNPILGAAVFSVLTGLGIEWMSNRTEVREDSAIGIFWSVGMALGIILIYLTPGYAPNLMSYLFGNILTVTRTDLVYLGLLTLVVVLFFARYYYPILFIAFDEEYARSHRMRVRGFKSVIMVLIALTIVLNIKVVGIILVISYLTIPQTTANLFSHNFRDIMLLSVAIALAGSMAGLMASYYLNIPSGATIIFSFIIIFVAARLIKTLTVRKRKAAAETLRTAD